MDKICELCDEIFEVSHKAADGMYTLLHVYNCHDKDDACLRLRKQVEKINDAASEM